MQQSSRAIPLTMAAIIAATAMMFMLVVPAAADSALTATLTGEAEVPGPGDTEGSGSATVDITTDGGEICVDLTWDITDGAAAAAHIHEAAADAAGPVVLPLFTEPNDTGAFQDCFNDPALAAEIEAAPGNYYVNIHSENFPDGAIRGQLAAAGGGGGEPETGMLMIMKHYCNADDSNPETTVDIRSEEQFMEVEAGGGGNEVIAVALTILACPVERLPGDEPAPDSIAHFEEEFDFLVTDSTGATFTLADATFNRALVCEQDKEVSSGPDPIVIGEVDGNEDTNVCVDFSFYAIDGVTEGEVTVAETFHEGEHEFGTVRFTPAALDPDDDSRTLIDFDRSTSTVNIDTTLDDDGMVMLHVYNFDTAAAAPPPSAPPASMLPDTGVSSPGVVGSSGIAILLGIMVVASIGLVGLRTAAVRRNR